MHSQELCDDVIKWERFPHYWPIAGFLSNARFWCLFNLNKMLSKHSSCWWFEPTWCSCDVNVLTYLFTFVVLTALFKFPPMWKLVHTGPIISIFESNHRHYNWNLSPWRCSTHKIISMIKMGLNNHTLECCLTRAAWEAACLTWQPVLHHYYSMKWKHFPRYWPFVRGIHGSSVDSRHKGPVTRIFDDLFNVSLKRVFKTMEWLLTWDAVMLIVTSLLSGGAGVSGAEPWFFVIIVIMASLVKP